MPPRNRIPFEHRERIIRSFEDEEEDYILAADTLGVNPSTARGIVARYIREGRIEERPRGGRNNVRVDDEMRDCLNDVINDNCLLTLSRINQELRRRLPLKPRIHDRTVARTLDGMLFRVKLARPLPAERNRPDVLQKRVDYGNWFMNRGVVHHSVFVDECGYNIWTARSHGRARQGERAYRQVCGQRGRNITVTMAISPINGLVFHSAIIGGMNAQRFSDFLTQAILNLDPDEMVIFIYDGAPPHRNPAILGPNTELKMLPPYSPFLNIVEQAISSLKAAIKADISRPEVQAQMGDRVAARDQGLALGVFRTRLLLQALQRNTGTITPAKCAQWYRFMQTYLPRCLNGEVIEG
ncbi:uncharacterized protein LOC116619803 [Nematostella vectensis]|uniref:uncharacterized protein LOC116619803 n=1 Tax=Nematostella vectensis TaxID=45351 RepID=UPI00207778BC|nr:uncharacterized protein LOC116619803 [Nematostella vectensis]